MSDDQAGALTQEIAVSFIREFFRDKPFIVFGTGMSCALDSRFGMAALKDELLRKIVPDQDISEQVHQWLQVTRQLQSDGNLESALDAVTDAALLRKITIATGNFVSVLDREYSYRIANGESQWPATKFIHRIVDTLPEGDPVLHILTPNYDMLFEYACESVGVPYTSGFCGGVERREDWDAVNRCFAIPDRVYQRNRMKQVPKTRKHVRLYKVHGSLNYFFHRDAVIENNAWMWNAPPFSERVMITPGLSKYMKLQRYRQELLKSADAAIEKAGHFLFLGYGFNDGHLEEYIRRKLVAQSCKGLIITRDSNPRIEALLAEAPNLWLVSKSLGSGSNGSRIFNRQFSTWLDLPSANLWEIGEFTANILGGPS